MTSSHNYAVMHTIRNGSSFGSNDHYAKIWLEGFESGAAILWWAYQEVPGERQFGQPRPDSGEAREFVSGEEVR